MSSRHFGRPRCCEVSPTDGFQPPGDGKPVGLERRRARRRQARRRSCRCRSCRHRHASTTPLSRAKPCFAASARCSAETSARASTTPATVSPAAKRRVDRLPAVVIVGEQREPLCRCSGIAVDVGAHRRGQHDARHVVAAKDDRPLERACRDDRALRHDAPEPLARLVLGRHRQMVVDALERRIRAVVEDAGHRGARHDADIGHGAQFGDRAGRPSPSPACRRSCRRRESSRPPSATSSSQRMTRAPARPAASAAASPVGPPPAISTSQCAQAFS